MAATGAGHGPLDYALVGFSRGRCTFSGEVVSELVRLSHEGLIRVLDLLVIQKAADGSITEFETAELEGDDIRWLEVDLAEIVSAQDVQRLAAEMEPGSVAGVVVWENLWAVPLAAAAQQSGGRLIATGRVTDPQAATTTVGRRGPAAPTAGTTRRR